MHSSITPVRLHIHAHRAWKSGYELWHCSLGKHRSRRMTLVTLASVLWRKKKIKERKCALSHQCLCRVDIVLYFFFFFSFLSWKKKLHQVDLDLILMVGMGLHEYLKQLKAELCQLNHSWPENVVGFCLAGLLVTRGDWVLVIYQIHIMKFKALSLNLTVIEQAVSNWSDLSFI